MKERPKSAFKRKTIGHIEADTIVGKRGGAFVVTIADMASRFLLGGKAERKNADCVKVVILDALNKLPQKKIITPDRGREFTLHEEITQKTGIEFYFPPPHCPWDRAPTKTPMDC